MTVSVVVVTWRCAGELAALVGSMNRHLRGDEELVVVDNASDDDPASVAAAWKGPQRFIARADNGGFGVANNEGIAAARGDAVVMVNPDVELVDGCLGCLAELALERNALVGPRLLNADGSIQPSAAGPPAGPWPWVGAILPGAIAPAAVIERTEPWRLERTVPVAWLTGACFVAPRELLVGLGPFDPAIHMYAEDLDLGLRAGARGIQSLFAPGVCRVVHHGRRSSAQRFADAGLDVAAANRRSVVRRAHGAAAEARAWRADLLNLGLRAVAKRVLGQDASGDLRHLDAARAARPVPLPARMESRTAG